MANYDPCAKSVNKYVLEHSHSVQFSHSVTSDSLRPHGLQHARLPCPSPTPGACSNLRPLNRGLLQCRHILDQLSYEGNPNIAMFFHLLTVCECFGATMADFSKCNRDHEAHRSGPLQKKFANLYFITWSILYTYISYKQGLPRWH